MTDKPRIAIEIQHLPDGRAALFIAIHNADVEIDSGDTKFAVCDGSVDVYLGGLAKDVYFNCYKSGEGREEFEADLKSRRSDGEHALRRRLMGKRRKRPGRREQPPKETA